MEIIIIGVTASLVAGLMTAVGALGVYFVRTLTPKVEDSMLSFAAGIMLAASIFSLIIPAIEYGEAQFASKQYAVSWVVFAIMAGAVILYLIHKFVPHEHFQLGYEGPDTEKLSRIWLFIIAITLHNFPEGMAVGVGFAGEDISNGYNLALGIGIQNIPEGLAVALSLLSVGYSKHVSFFIAFITGLAEPIGGFIGTLASTFSGIFLPFSLAFAAGAMLFIISNEIIPETHRTEFATRATFALLIGFGLMMYLDATLG